MHSRGNAGLSTAVPTALSRPRSGFISARAVGSYVPKLTHKAFERYGFAAAALITDWEAVVGKEVAAYAAPERLKWPRKPANAVESETGEVAGAAAGGTLIVRVDPARALDVQYRAQQLIERINAHFGYRAVAELRILQAPLPAPRQARPASPPVVPGPSVPSAELAAVADDRLRSALASLQSGLRARRPAG